MSIFRRKTGSRTPVAPAAFSPPPSSSPDQVLASGVSTIAQHLTQRLESSIAQPGELAAELSQWARQGWAREREALVENGTFDPRREADAEALFTATKMVFDGSTFHHLAAGIAAVQREAAFRVFALLGLAQYDAAAGYLVLRIDGRGTGIVDTLPGLDRFIGDDDEARRVFVAATDTVMWGVATALAEQQLQDPAGPGRKREDTTYVPAARPPKAHVLSFPDFARCFDAQAAIMDEMPAVTEITLTGDDGAELRSLAAGSDPPRDLSGLAGRQVLIAYAPQAADTALAAAAGARGGRYEFTAEP